MANDITALSPVEIDTFLSANYQEQQKLWNQIGSQVQHIERLKKSLARQNVERTEYFRQIDEADGELEALRANLRQVQNASLPYLVEYDRRPWNRYFLVDNVNGHVHRGMNCSTCFRDTRYSWLVDLADCDEDAMVAEWGERACTVCFPSAPTNPLYNRPARIDREAQEARAAEKAAKDAAKAEKAITDVDGSPLKDSMGYPLKTKVAARNELSSAFQSLAWYGEHPQDFAGVIRRLVPALNAAGVDWQRSATNALKKATKEGADASNVRAAEALLKEVSSTR